MIIQSTSIHRYCSVCGKSWETVIEPQKEVPETGCGVCVSRKPPESPSESPEEALLKKLYGD